MAQKCDVIHTVDDASFGYWDQSWGDSPIHEFPCGGDAVVIMQDPGDDEGTALCAEHAKEALR
jgi:hypothetical protein